MRTKRRKRKKKPYFLLFVEGEKTEKKYFEDLRKLLPEVAIKVQPIHSPAEFLKKYPRRFQPLVHKADDDSHIWFVLDTESHTPSDALTPAEIEELNEVLKPAQASYALSNPCFEIWLILHDQPHASGCHNPKKCHDCMDKLYPSLNYKRDKLPPEYDMDRIRSAKDNAENIAKLKQCLEGWPDKPGVTHVYQLIEQILLSAA